MPLPLPLPLPLLGRREDFPVTLPPAALLPAFNLRGCARGDGTLPLADGLGLWRAAPAPAEAGAVLPFVLALPVLPAAPPLVLDNV